MNSPVPVISPHKGQWRGALMFTLICVWINGWVNNREAGDLRRYRGHYDVIVMQSICFTQEITTPVHNIVQIGWGHHGNFCVWKKSAITFGEGCRPVSILIALSNIREKAMSLQISEYFNNIFSSLLSVFRKDYIYQSTLLNMIDDFNVHSTEVSKLHVNVLVLILARPLIVYLTV